MIDELVFMVEEPSMKEVLDVLLPKIVPDGVTIRIITHSGKGDLERSIPIKLRGWANPHARFVIVRDNDGGDCVQLKDRLKGVCAANFRPDSLVRIVCQELESWFLGDLGAVQASGLAKPRNVSALQNRNPYRDPDHIIDAKGKLRDLAPTYYPRSGSRAIAPHLTLDNNLSKSFNVFVTGVKRLAEQRGTA